ncbi:MAG: hypothetical protein LBI69_03515 [Puniceicoccales bacterium]|nr:hypothetical protein [Puniceicoccales bacterium]
MSIFSLKTYAADLQKEKSDLFEAIKAMGPNVPNVFSEQYMAVSNQLKEIQPLVSLLESVGNCRSASAATIGMYASVWLAAKDEESRCTIWNALLDAIAAVMKQEEKFDEVSLACGRANERLINAEFAAKIALTNAEINARNSIAQAKADAEAMLANVRAATLRRQAKYDTQSWFGRVFVGISSDDE